MKRIARFRSPGLWFFGCLCPRCQEPGECGLHLGSLLCPGEGGGGGRGCQGAVLPLHPLLEDSHYQCESCQLTLTSEQVTSINQEAEEEIKRSRAGDLLGNLEGFLHRHGSVLHPGHHTIVAASLRLGWLYGRWPGGGLAALTRPERERKVQCCSAALATLATLDSGGRNRWRERMVGELAAMARLA